jgi:2-keto-3-deoxy-L-rhamnonate aldolase RhmA
MDPRVQTEVKRIHAAARTAGKPAMIVALDHEDGRRLLAEGYQALLVVTGPMIVNAARSFLQVLRA